MVRGLDEFGRRGLTRRSFLKGSIVAGAIAVFGSLAATVKSAISPVKPPCGPQWGPIIYTSGPNKGRQAKVSDFAMGEGQRGFMNGDRCWPVLIFKPEPSRLKSTDGVVEGLLAFGSVCTHFCCHTNYGDGVNSSPPNLEGVQKVAYFWCTSCHFSLYDPYDKARVLRDPAPRPLPLLELAVDGSGGVSATGIHPQSLTQEWGCK